MTLSGKSALITGASRGVGAATARQLALTGCRVAINYQQSAEHAEAVAHQCREAGVEALVVQGDVAEDNACRRRGNVIGLAIRGSGALGREGNGLAAPCLRSPRPRGGEWRSVRA